MAMRAATTIAPPTPLPGACRRYGSYGSYGSLGSLAALDKSVKGGSHAAAQLDPIKELA